LNKFFSKIAEPKPVGLNRFQFDFFNRFGVFLYKNQAEQKIINHVGALARLPLLGPGALTRPWFPGPDTQARLNTVGCGTTTTPNAGGY